MSSVGPTPNATPLVATYLAEDFGPSHRWVVFVCSADGHPMCVGYAEDEYESCPACGAALTPILVRPVEQKKEGPAHV